MAQVIVTIDGRSYRMACEAGQEPYIQELATDLDKRVTDLRSQFGTIGDMRLLLMAALILSDDVRGFKKEIEELKIENRQLSALKESLVEQNQREYWQMSQYISERAKKLEQASDSLAEALKQKAGKADKFEENFSEYGVNKDNGSSQTSENSDRIEKNEVKTKVNSNSLFK